MFRVAPLLLLTCALSCGSEPVATHQVGQILTPMGEIIVWLHHETPTHREAFIEIADAGSWGVLTIAVPRDFDGELSWTLVANDQPVTIPFHLRAAYFVEPFEDRSNNNEPPTIRFAQGGTPFTGPPVGIAHTMTAAVGRAVALPVWLSDVTPDRNVRDNPRRRRPPLVLRWHKLRGPGDVEFDEPEREFEDAVDHNPTTSITFEAAGEYWLRAEALDSTGDGWEWVSMLLDVGGRAGDGVRIALS